ncbi:hypothetical protein ACS0TY_013448 [Phlomoides rotata]
MAPKKSLRTTFLYVVASIFFCASLYHHYLRDAISAFSSDQLALSPAVISLSIANSTSSINCEDDENVTDAAAAVSPQGSAADPPSLPPPISTTAVLLPDWEVLVIVSPETTPSNLDGNYSCYFETKEVSPASFSSVIPFPDRATFSCIMPMRVRRRFPFKVPLFLKNQENPPEIESPLPPLIRTSFMVYDSLTTEDDVVLFVKGVNTRQGINRSPKEFQCVFGDDGVKTAVTASMQEVFRCKRPEPAIGAGLKVSVEIVAENRVVPSVAYYTPPRTLGPSNGRSLLCATTMVYDVTKYLKEWILYNSKIGVQKFLLYDNGSDDDLEKAVNELVAEGFDISTYFWRWPKTQEAGFSHSALYAKDACTWMMYMDVDEFLFSPSWYNHSQPSTSLLHSLISPSNSSSSKLGQISINCHEFGPSGQQVHPAMGVIQGYNCRRKLENRHKSIVLLKSVDDCLVNVIHHFHLKKGYRTRKPSTSTLVVNHYKYQAWPEFKAKFRRRVSAYVLDWTNNLNPNSNDRTPGLGFSPVEPKGWPHKFCEIHDNRLKDLTLRWFGIESSESGVRMAWQ